MNYLAHFYLAAEDEGLIIGNILADYKKGKQYLELPEDIQRGVLLHRSIDDFTDNHPEVEKTKARLRKKYRKFAPVISDVFYDFILGNNWKDYSSQRLDAFSSDIYKVLLDNTHILPIQAQMTVGYMSKNDWLYHYSTFWGIEMALKGLSRRTTFDTNMHEAIEDLKRDEAIIEKEFRHFFEDLRSHVSNELKRF